MKKGKTLMNKNFLAITVALACNASAFAQTATPTEATATPSSFWINFADYIMNPMVWFFAFASMILLIVFYTLSKSAVALSQTISSKSKKTFLIAVMLFASASTFAQATPDAASPLTSPNSFWIKFADYIDDPMILFFLGVTVVLLIVFHSLSRSVIILSRQVAGIKEETKKFSAKEKVKTKSAYSKLMGWLTRSVPVSQEEDVMLDHNYDGIRELDNQLPPWWKWGFYFTILFAFVYLFYYHVSGKGKLQLSEYAEELRSAQLAKDERMKDAANNINDANVIAFTDAHEIGEGKNIYVKNCVACHGNDGQGGVGPNLTDDFWLHGGGVKNVFRTIAEGVPIKGMISWKTQLAPKQIQEVASFVLTLHGTNPAGAKEPQGDIWKDEIKTDSTAATVTAISSVQ
jgi:cytochrome c oxidase cbb3-type subunit 3